MIKCLYQSEYIPEIHSGPLYKVIRQSISAANKINLTNLFLRAYANPAQRKIHHTYQITCKLANFVIGDKLQNMSTNNRFYAVHW